MVPECLSKSWITVNYFILLKDHSQYIKKNLYQNYAQLVSFLCLISLDYKPNFKIYLIYLT